MKIAGTVWEEVVFSSCRITTDFHPTGSGFDPRATQEKEYKT